jgi:hypothetical protein
MRTLNPLPAGFVGLLVAALTLSACDSFVDKAPISNPTKEQFYDTPADFETALNGAYAALQQEGTFSRNFWVLFEMRSDNTDQGPDQTGLARTLFLINQFQETTTNGVVQQTWLDAYDGIERCNVILDNAENLSDSDLQDQVRGEALFLRSLLYYHLAVGFGNVSLRTTATTGPDDAAAATSQVPAEEVYTQIAGDLETAQDLLPNRSELSAGEIGTATSGAANALLGKVYLTLGQSSDAETALRRVVQSNEYRLLDNYGDLWGPDNENNDESIFEVQYTAGGSGEGSPFTNTFSPSAVLQTGEGLAENRPTPSLVDAYADGGERLAASIDTTYQDEEGETVNARYITKFESDPFANFDAENNWVVLRYADVLLMLAEAIGPSGEAWDLIDEVRNRAGLADVQRTDFYETLLAERRVELAFENHRWPDLKRFNQYISGVAEDRLNEEVSDLSGFNLLYPIPQREVDVADLTQNDGYD